MIFKKNIEDSTVNNVFMANGTVKFHSVRMNVYSFITDGIAIDAGPHALKDGLIPFFQNHPMDALYCTHIHEDHTGNANWLQQQYDVPIYINEKSVNEAEKNGKYPIYRRLFWGKRNAFQPTPMPEKFTSRNGEWISIFTPGHSYDHMALLNKTTGQLFSGDLYVQRKTKVILEDESIPQIIQSLKHILTFDFAEVFCHHAGYLKDGRTKLQNKLDYLEQLNGEVLELHRQGLSVDEIHRHFFPKKYPIIAFSFGQWNSKHIITSILK
jgi:glyoxylase-like metal-dependent hydrolase (beta-lactamase superfamily II)